MSSEEPKSPKASSGSKPSPVPGTDTHDSTQDGRQDSWEVVESLSEGVGKAQTPEKQEGVLLKRRKWPMKGWHKRFFSLERGILTYAKTGPDLKRGKIRGRIDVGLSVMSIKKRTMCIDLDTGDSIYHLKLKSRDQFDAWVTQLRHHRVFRQNEISMDPHEEDVHPDPASTKKRSTHSRQPSAQLRSNWLHHSEDMERCCKDLSDSESSLLELNLLLKNMEHLHRTFSAPAINTLQAEGSRKDKKGHKRWRSKNNGKDGKDTKNTLQVPGLAMSRMHASSPNLIPPEQGGLEPYLECPDSPTDAARLQEQFCNLASTVHTSLQSAYRALSAERDRVKHTLELQGSHISDVADGRHPLLQQMSNDSRMSIPESVVEFFDAKEYLLSSSSSEYEGSDDDSYLSDASDSVSVEFCRSDSGTNTNIASSPVADVIQRRKVLPSESVGGGVNLWSILRNNIGKDLSKVTMPIQLNEPLNTLQRLCEEIEYCHLLDTAAQTEDPCLRMVYVAAFAISAYASTFTRAGGKPFNPILGETYECERTDKGFRFISEQVSHHPPVSACHCESDSFTLWQDVRWKNKFWGKSMEIVPMGTIHVMLPEFGDHYQWNKVTTCIHNVLSGERWIEHYGEMSIKNTVATGNSCQCRVTFLKTRSGGLNINEVEGVVTDSDGHVVHSLFGKWHEALYLGDPPSATCIWRANPMPDNYEKFYGFTQFAVELNELEESLKASLPPTDTRFRPDQRLLEEGDMQGAEEQKQRIEGLQRERRRIVQENNLTHTPRFFKQSADDSWVSNGTYWNLRKDPGFDNLDFPVLW
ncbi:oxysterol-binding protein-related protein 3a [Chanos chanos]|uniref:Oxysterol-binding protein n=1 Tax=Chanos chanos TaxID=29144 RepID=A0A6J2WHG6_CHACN|nr:oxysterol-binding protein-related protein 3-like [Chanos chanos]